MSLRSIHLRKLLKILYSEPNRRTSALRADIRDDIARERGLSEGGGDFYVPFWRDAKDHVFGTADLHARTNERVSANANRTNLYPRLRDGFLEWWNERRRWTNEPFIPVPPPKIQFNFPGIDATVKVDNILSVQDGSGINHFIYPYFSPDPALTSESARLGLWLLDQALPETPIDEIRILDVLRGFNHSPETSPLQGDEELIFRRRYEAAIAEWDRLREEY